MYEIFKPYLGEAFTALLVGFPTWYFTKRKNNAEVAATEIDNGGKVVELYKSALDDLPERYEEKFKTLNELFTQKETILKEEIEFLKKERNLWKKKYTALLKEYHDYKKAHP